MKRSVLAPDETPRVKQCLLGVGRPRHPWLEGCLSQLWQESFPGYGYDKAAYWQLRDSALQREVRFIGNYR
eukprot:1702123-Amphidinium_carterae.2